MKKLMIGIQAMITMSYFVVSLALSTPAHAEPTAEVTESFDTADSATANGWTGSQNSDSGANYGFSDSSNAGGTAGEAGGVFARVGADSYYADLTLGGAFTRKTDFSAAGKFDMSAVGSTPNTAVYLGFLDPALGVTKGFAGIAFIDEGSGFKFAPIIRFGDGTELTGKSINVTAEGLGVDRTFTLTWDADGGANGHGRLTVSISGDGGESISVDLSDTHDAGSFNLSAFGLAQRALSSPNPSQDFTLTGYMDDVTYSVVPETAK